MSPGVIRLLSTLLKPGLDAIAPVQLYVYRIPALLIHQETNPEQSNPSQGLDAAPASRKYGIPLKCRATSSIISLSAGVESRYPSSSQGGSKDR